MEQYWGYHLLLDIRGCNRESIKNKAVLTSFVKELVEKIEMKAYGEPILEHFATHNPLAAGYSLLQLIETSSITGHFVDANGDAYIDIFSCKTFDEKTAIDVIEKYFSPEEVSFKFLQRSARHPALT